MIKISPSILSCDFSRLKDEIQEVENLGADLLHIDVMDGHFVPNITIGPCVIEHIKKFAKIPLDSHLMIENPKAHIKAFKGAGTSGITFHIETTREPLKLIDEIKKNGISVGVAVSPDTDVADVFSVLDKVDKALIMTVYPGFGGQRFMEDMIEKVKILREKVGNIFDIEVDGGINPDTVVPAARAGANIIVAGTSIFKAKDRKKAIDTIRHNAETYFLKPKE